MRTIRIAALALTSILIAAATATAATQDVAGTFSNIGFELGNISGWTVTQPNANHVASLPENVNQVNPTIDPADGANNPTTLVAPVGSYFTGLERPGDVGPDLAYKLAHNVASISAPSGTVFGVTVWANRGRLEPFDTPASTADALIKIFGWNAGSSPTVTAASDNWSRSITWKPASQSFTNWAADGQWASQTFFFTSTANLSYLSISIDGRNMNHDQYIAMDIGVIPEPSSVSLVGLAVFGLVAGLRSRHKKR